MVLFNSVLGIRIDIVGWVHIPNDKAFWKVVHIGDSQVV